MEQLCRRSWTRAGRAKHQSTTEEANRQLCTEETTHPAYGGRPIVCDIADWPYIALGQSPAENREGFYWIFRAFLGTGLRHKCRKFNSASNGIVGVENDEIYVLHKNYKVGLGTVENGIAASVFPPGGSEKRELCRKGHIEKNWKLNLATSKFE